MQSSLTKIEFIQEEIADTAQKVQHPISEVTETVWGQLEGEVDSRLSENPGLKFQ